MRRQTSAIQTNATFNLSKLSKFCLSLVVGGSFLISAQSSFAYAISQPNYQQGHMEISKEHFQATMINPTQTNAGSQKSTAAVTQQAAAAKPKVELTEEQKQKMQELSQTLPEMPKPILTEVARLSAEKDLLLLFGADKFYTFLGCVNCSANEALSIWNSKGPYGSYKSPYSLWSANNEFGNASGQYSPWNAFGRKPPFLIDTKGNVHGVLTLNNVNQHQSQGLIANFLYKNHEQIRLDPSTWFKTLFKDSSASVLDIPETAISDNHETDLNLEALQANRK